MPLANLQEEIPGQITRKELLAAAEKHGWGEATVTNVDVNEYWTVKYRIPIDNGITEHLNVTIDSVATVNDTPINNVFIRGDSIRIDTYEDFEPIRKAVESNEHVFVDMHTSEKGWRQLTASDSDVTIDDANIPREDVFDTITGKGIVFNAVIKYLNSSAELTIDELIEGSETITAVYHEIEKANK